MLYYEKNINMPVNEREFNDSLLAHLIMALQPYPVTRYNEVNISGREQFLSSFYYHMALHAPTQDAYYN